MTIGQQLKKTRLLFGLTQEEMSAGIVSESFYSRVERDKNAITINKLIAMLNANNISLNDFFKTFDNEGMPELKLQRQIYSAFNDRDLDQLHQIEKTLSSKNDVLYFKTKLIIATLEHRSIKMPDSIRKQLKTNLIDLDLKEQDFWDLAISVPLYQFSELTPLMSYIIAHFSKLDLDNPQVVISLMNLLIGYLDRAYREKHLVEAKKTLNFANKIPNDFEIMFHKLIIKYYSALIDKNLEMAKGITDLLQICGYQRYIDMLPQANRRSK